jgi:hypothetical protein
MTKSIGEVYFIQAGSDGPIKIGWASVVGKRLTALQTSHWEELTLLATIPCSDKSEEGRIHSMFAQERMRGEWFRASERLVAYAKEYSAFILPPREIATETRNPSDRNTTLTTKIWVAEELVEFRNLFLNHGAASVLPDDLLDFARKQACLRQAWPQWLMLGVALKIARLWTEAFLSGSGGVLAEDIIDVEPNQRATTLTTRFWVSEELGTYRDLIILKDGGRALPSGLRNFAWQQVARTGGGWPRWLVLGVAVKLARLWIKQQMAARAKP